MTLPIDVIPGTNPPRFRWKKAVETPNGRVVQDHEGMLPPSVEGAVANLIAVTKQLQTENKRLYEQVEDMAARGKITEVPAQHSSSSRKGKGAV